MRLTHLPTTVEAEQWFPHRGPMDGVCVDGHCSTLPAPHVHTLEGAMRVSPGDWIVTGVAGEKYPVKPDIVRAIYAPDEGYWLDCGAFLREPCLLTHGHTGPHYNVTDGAWGLR